MPSVTAARSDRMILRAVPRQARMLLSCEHAARRSTTRGLHRIALPPFARRLFCRRIVRPRRNLEFSA